MAAFYFKVLSLDHCLDDLENVNTERTKFFKFLTILPLAQVLCNQLMPHKYLSPTVSQRHHYCNNQTNTKFLLSIVHTWVTLKRFPQSTAMPTVTTTTHLICSTSSHLQFKNKSLSKVGAAFKKSACSLKRELIIQKVCGCVYTRGGFIACMFKMDTSINFVHMPYGVHKKHPVGNVYPVG